MPQVKGAQKNKSGGRQTSKGRGKPGPAPKSTQKQASDASSIITGVFFLGAILVGAAAWMGQSISVVEDKANQLADGAAKAVGLSIRSIQIIEASDDQKRVIRSELGVTEGDSMFRADPQALKARIEAVRGFGDIQVHRFWPNQVAVFVTPLQASVMYRENDQKPLQPMHITGEAAATSEEDFAFPVVQGDGAIAAWPLLQSELRAYPVIETRLDFAERINDRRWDLLMTTGVRVNLPSGTDRHSAIEVLAELQRQTGVLDRDVERVDLRDPERIYVKRRNSEFALADIGGAG